MNWEEIPRDPNWQWHNADWTAQAHVEEDDDGGWSWWVRIQKINPDNSRTIKKHHHGAEQTAEQAKDEARKWFIRHHIAVE